MRALVLWVLLPSTLLKLALLIVAQDMTSIGDENQYLAGGRSIYETGVPEYRGWNEAHAAPGMPYFIAACYALAGESGFQLLARVLQVLASTGTVFLTFALARRFLSGRTALVAAALVAYNPTQVAFSHYFWSETLYAFLATGALLPLLLARERVGFLRWLFVAGLLGGLTTLTRSFFLTQIPLVLLWIAAFGGGERRRRVLGCALYALGVCLVVLPWSVRNTLRYDRFLLVSTNAGGVMHKGANVLAPQNRDIGFEGWVTRARERDDERPRSDAENIVDQYQEDVRAGLQFMLANPGLTLHHSFLRVQYLLNPTTFLVRHVREGNYGEVPRPLAEVVVVLVLGTSMAWMALFAIALAEWSTTSARRDPLTWLLVAMVLSTVAVCALTASHTRYRVPLLPLAAPLCADVLLRLWRREFVWSKRVLVLAVPLLGFLVWVWVRYLPNNFPGSPID